MQQHLNALLTSAEKLGNEAEREVAPLQRGPGFITCSFILRHLRHLPVPCVAPEPPALPASITLPLAPHWSPGNDAAWKRRDRTALLVTTGGMKRARKRVKPSEKQTGTSRTNDATEVENKSLGGGGVSVMTQHVITLPICCFCQRWRKYQ